VDSRQQEQKLRRQKVARKFERFRGVADVNRNDGRFTDFELEAALFQLAFEEFCVGPQFLDELFSVRRIEQREAAWQAAAVAGGCEVENKNGRARR